MSYTHGANRLLFGATEQYWRASRMQIGPQIRAARGERGWSLRHLAGRAQVSPSLLSEVERGFVTPSMSTLFQIASALELPVQTLLPPIPGQPAGESRPTVPLAASRTTVVRRAERPRIQLTGGIAWERLAPHGDATAECIEVIYQPGSGSGEEMLHHPGREFGVVLAGELTLDLAFERHVLQAGDSIAFESTVPHRFTNSGSEPLRLLWTTIRPPAAPTQS